MFIDRGALFLHDNFAASQGADSCSSRPSKRNDAARRNGMMPPTITR
jgi:hypothetical protein